MFLNLRARRSKTIVVLAAMLMIGYFPASTAGNVTKPGTVTKAEIVIHGDTDCSDGHQSNACGWGDNGGWTNPPNGGGNDGGGNTGGGGTSTVSNDGTKGKTLDQNRTKPGCLAEQLFMEEVVNTVYSSGVPMGTYVPIGLNDPVYSNGEWFKYQTEMWSSTWSAPDSKFMEIRIQVHYMWNQVTGQVAQVKLKNSFQYGCQGFPKQ